MTNPQADKKGNDFISDLHDIPKSRALYERAKELIPGGGTMLLSKLPELGAPGRQPVYYRRAQGCEVEDIDGNVFIDFIGDVGATILGRADPDVNAAVHAAVDQGNFCTLNNPCEVELAELLTEIIPCAQQVRFASGGGEADAVAIRIARGYTGRDIVAFCGYHGWHDWYLAANLGKNGDLDGHLMPGLISLGVPRQLEGTALPFEYNNLDSLKKLLESKPGQFAAIIMEATRSTPPVNGFLQGVRELATKHGAVLIFDEVVTGFRMALGGAQEYFGVTPDLATFAKSISNGYAMAAITGQRKIMETVNNQFISSTYWTDALGVAAALASLKKIRDTGVIEYVWDIGQKLMTGLENALKTAGVAGKVTGWPPILGLAFDHQDEEMARAIATFFVRRQLARGFLVRGHYYLTAAHTAQHLDQYLLAARDSLEELKLSLANGNLMRDIEFSPSRPLFKRFA